MSSATATPDIGVAGIGETSRLDDGFQHLHAFNQAQANINGSKPDSRTDEGIVGHLAMTLSEAGLTATGH